MKTSQAKTNTLLLVDNSPSHMVDTQYFGIKIVFLPQNTTSKLQPLDQHIIRGVKMFYHNAITERIWAHVDKDKEELKEVMNILDFVVVCENTVDAWNYITDTLIQKIFQKAGFITMVPTCPKPEPHTDCNLWDNVQRLPDINVPFEEFAMSDDNVETSEELSEGDIIN